MANHPTNRNVLYRIFDSDGQLLYVGATTNPGVRFTQHAAGQPWWDDAANITLERFDTYEALIEEERQAIEAEDPRYNTHGMDGPAWGHKPRRPKGEGSLYQRGDGYWVAAVQFPAGPNRSRRMRRAVRKSRADARRRLDEMLAEAGYSGCGSA